MLISLLNDHDQRRKQSHNVYISRMLSLLVYQLTHMVGFTYIFNY